MMNYVLRYKTTKNGRLERFYGEYGISSEEIILESELSDAKKDINGVYVRGSEVFYPVINRLGKWVYLSV